MAKLINEGMWACTVLGAEVGQDDRNAMRVRIHVMITEGSDKGRKVTYEDVVNYKSSKYIAQSCKAVGWRGGRLEEALRGDVDAWIAVTGGVSTVEIRHLEIRNGKNAGSMWAKANSIGRGSRPLAAPSREIADDAHEAMMAALEADESADSAAPGGGGYGGGGGSGGGYGAPPPGDDDVPFIFCVDIEPSSLSRVTRRGA
jgi:hypothetical protein